MKARERRVCDNISELLLEADMDQQIFAKAVGTNADTVSIWVCRHNDPRMKYIPGIAKCLGVPIDRLFEGCEYDIWETLE